jgi:predicted dehydrogenase/NADPH:quinone reductase-like Zn-dependent oxidoreductase
LYQSEVDRRGGRPSEGPDLDAPDTLPPVPRLTPAAQVRVRDLQVAVATRLGLTPAMAFDVRREVMWWVWARAQAARNRRGLRSAWAVGWTSSGYGELLPVEVPRPGRGRVTVATHTSAVSPGTERARYLRLPNASMGLGMPGNSASGVVLEAGPGVSGLAPGDPVAAAGARHASISTVEASRVYPIPAGVDPVAAAMVYLGIISGQGVTAGGLVEGGTFAVVGAGLVGVLAQRIGVARGGTCAAVITRSRDKAGVLDGGAGRHLLADDTDALEQLACPVVIEASGSPDGVLAAARAAAPGGTVVLLGSPRGVTRELPLAEIRRRRLRMVGAHVDMLAERSERSGRDEERAEGDAFMAALATGRLDVHDLAGDAVDPREAGLFYRELATRGDLVGAHFDWSRLPVDYAVRRGHLLRPPSIAARGLDYARRPLPVSGRPPVGGTGVAFGFEGARGKLRIGLMGCGDIGIDNALAAAVAPNTRLAAVFDPVQRLAREVAESFGADVAPTPEALMDHAGVDAVLLAVPHDMHAPLAVQAAQAGKHVIVEKPQANTLAAARAMTEAVRAAGRELSVCFPYRYTPKVIVARHFVEAGGLGRFTGSHVRLFMDKTPAYWIGGFSGRAQSDWRASKARAGGGIFIMNLTHYVDLVRHLVGVEVDEVWGSAGTVEGATEVEDTIAVTLRFANGAIGTLVGCSSVRGTLSEECRIWGADGHLAVEPEPRLFTLRAVDGLRSGRWQAPGRLPGSARIRAVYLSRLATALDEGRPPEIGAADGLAVQSVVEAAYLSAERGEGVRPADLLEEVPA